MENIASPFTGASSAVKPKPQPFLSLPRHFFPKPKSHHNPPAPLLSRRRTSPSSSLDVAPLRAPPETPPGPLRSLGPLLSLESAPDLSNPGSSPLAIFGSLGISIPACFVREPMTSCAVSNSVEVGSNDIYVDEDENNQRIQMRLDITDPYIYYAEAVDEAVDEPVDEADDEPLSNDASKPYVGMEFSTPEEAYNFYNNYAYLVGFSVRKATTTSNKNGLSSIRYVCSKEGSSTWHKRKERPIGSSTDLATPEKEHGVTRINCKASFRIKILKSGNWKVSVFVEDHNHELITSPSKIRNLRSHKRMTTNDKDVIRNLSAQNVGTSQILEYVAIQYRGKQDVRFKRKDVSNLIAGDNRKLIGIDVHTTLIYFQKKQEEDPEFFHSVSADEHGVVKNIFWVDGRARRAYKEFGDVVTFDTTYQTNKYNMPFALFIGVNHHRQSILFGMALLKCETAENFCWLFETWLVAMYDKHPSAIITEQPIQHLSYGISCKKGLICNDYFGYSFCLQQAQTVVSYLQNINKR